MPTTALQQKTSRATVGRERDRTLHHGAAFYRVDLYATGRLVDGAERELGRASTIEDATRLYDEQAAL